MTPAEAGRLLAHCAAFDNRQPSRAASEGWAAALRDVPLDEDALASVARYYGTPPRDPGQRLWIQPHDVRTLRKTIRSERLETYVYDGDPDESTQQYLTRRRHQLAAVASGHQPSPSARVALTGPPHPKVAALLSGVGHAVDDDTAAEIAAVRRPGPLGTDCPTCSAPIGRPCRTPSGKPRAAHRHRVDTAFGHEMPDAGAAEREMDRRRDASRRYLEASSTQDAA
ncbi:hypothetical protein [Streptomyces sp. UNOC14_S4]|uniref:zinc finger domain-containing protein n=1 Tax=Streptomyces sp. UNOC14_S4 TaxID=2872340 RepID=UPI001E3FEE98|nr:hypothetical protein [Streptomyces sp. UNOC14_S4]MCC3766028.1 hypothetical protein [Streptomyces sp. UNOC14_S4]